jgi:phosphatidylserine/phosphatidylglycerophosphate/cardiolipin synthase-like enzyme
VSITITGTVVDENDDGVGGVTVEARGDWLLTSEVLDATTSRNTGDFTLVLKGVVGEPTRPASCRVRAVDGVGRAISDDKEVSGLAGNQAIGPIKVRTADRTGLEVTLGRGQAPMVSDGNALTILIDGEEAFGRTAADIEGATASVDMTQLFFGVPEFDPDRAKEHPQLVFAFGPPPIVPLDPPPPGQQAAKVPRPNDRRPEQLLLDAAARKVRVRVLMNKPTIGWPEAIIYLTVLTTAAAGLGVRAGMAIAAAFGVGLILAAFVAGALYLAITGARKVADVLDSSSDAEELRTYFEHGLPRLPPPRGSITVRPFEQPAPNHGVLHCKMVIVDDERAVVLGSPFSQRYFDGLLHEIDNPQRGDTTSDIVHDVSLAVIGPAVRDLHETFRTYWNEGQTSGEQITSIPADQGPSAQTTGDDGVARVQVTRTLSADRFASLGGTHEKGILESYLRAFDSAQRLIFLETQYFTDAIITEALKTVLKRRTDLELILMLNIKPDVPLYPGRQARLVGQIRDAAPDRVGVFTRWSYDHRQPRPWVAPVYLHSKIGVVDDSWATIGSANLDGLSLDKNLLLSPLVFGETMAAELNVTILSSTVGTNGMQPAERTRRRLWAEHLGIPDDAALAMSPGKKWVPFWKQRAMAALQHVQAGNRTALPGFVLEYTAAASEHDTPRKHLAALDVELDLARPVVRPIGRTRAFDFFTGRWKAPNREDFVGATRREDQ